MNPTDWSQRLRQQTEQRDEELAMQALAQSASPGTYTGQPLRIALLAISLGLLALLAWLAWAPLTQGVPVEGYVKTDGNRKTIQHLRGGVVDAVLVRDGDAVQAGQPLVRLNQAQAQSQQGSVDQQLLHLLAVQARLQAERLEQPRIAWPSLDRQQTAVREVIDVQTQLFNSRRNALRAETAISEEAIRGLEQHIAGLNAQDEAMATQARLFADELASLRPLFEQGFVPRNRIFELERAIAHTAGQRSEYRASIARARSQIGEHRLRIVHTRENYRKDAQGQLTDIQRQIAELKERRIATQDELDRVTLRAPEAGTVVELAVTTPGAVLTPGQKIMDIVPTGTRLVVEVMIPPHLIENVRVGQEADLMILSMDQAIVPAVPARLVYLGADRQTDPRTAQAYFVGRLEPTPQALTTLGPEALRPGAPAQAVIKTAERSALGYLLKPLVNRLRMAFTER